MAIENLVATTELEAINSMLAAIGEAPIADVETATQADVEMAVSFLRNATREIQALGWRFNSEFGLAVAPAVTDFSWTDPDGGALDIDIFTLPAGVISFTVTPLPSQILSTYGAMLDVVERRSKQYVDGASASVLVLYDRLRNRDGFPAGERDFLYLDTVSLFDFADLPESARRYITITAARRFIQSVLGDAQLAGYQRQDEMIALRALMRDQGDKDDTSMLDNPEVARMFGGRPRRGGLFVSRRSRPVGRP